MRTCEAAPATPGGTAYTQKDVAIYVSSLFEAWDDCHGNLHAVDAILTDAEKTAHTR